MTPFGRRGAVGSRRRSRRPGPPTVVTAPPRAFIALAITACSLLAACSPAPVAGGGPAAPTPTVTSVISPVATTSTISPPPSGNGTLAGSQDGLAQAITMAVNAATAGRAGRLNLAIHAPAKHVYAEVGSSTPVRSASVIKLRSFRPGSRGAR